VSKVQESIKEESTGYWKFTVGKISFKPTVKHGPWLPCSVAQVHTWDDHPRHMHLLHQCSKCKYQQTRSPATAGIANRPLLFLEHRIPMPELFTVRRFTRVLDAGKYGCPY